MCHVFNACGFDKMVFWGSMCFASVIIFPLKLVCKRVRLGYVYLWKSADLSLRRWQIHNGMSLEYSLMRDGHCRSRIPHSYQNIALKHLRWQTLLYLNCVSCTPWNVYHQVQSAPSLLKFLSLKLLLFSFCLFFSTIPHLPFFLLLFEDLKLKWRVIDIKLL